jgi:hypothetical protein
MNETLVLVTEEVTIYRGRDCEGNESGKPVGGLWVLDLDLLVFESVGPPIYIYFFYDYPVLRYIN